jgi:hypothetical protein
MNNRIADNRRRGSRVKLVRVAGTAVLAAAVGLGLSAGIAPARAQSAQSAQNQRVLEGSVRDAAGQPLSGAIVYLKNAATLTVKTYVTQADGNFRFGHVGMDADYEVYAEAGGKKSKVKRISAFDTKKRWTIALQIER